MLSIIILILTAVAAAEAVAAFKCTGCRFEVSVMIAILSITAALVLLEIADAGLISGSEQ